MSVPTKLGFGCVVMVAMALGSGCAETQYRGRDIFRQAAFRNAPVRSDATDTPSPVPELRLSDEAADDDETAFFASETRDAFDLEMQSDSDATLAVGTAALQRCGLAISIGRKYTIYFARCRAAWLVNGVPVVQVEAEAKRRVSAQAITEDEAKAIRPGKRHPLKRAPDSIASLKDAAILAARLLRDPDATPPFTGTEKQAAERKSTYDAHPKLRADAVAALSNRRPERRSAAAIDLVNYGRGEDAKKIVPLLDDDFSFVRRSAATALAELATPETAPALFRHRTNADPAVQTQVEIALTRLLALHPEIVAPPLGPPPPPPTGIRAVQTPTEREPRPPRAVIGVDGDDEGGVEDEGEAGKIEATPPQDAPSRASATSRD